MKKLREYSTDIYIEEQGNYKISLLQSSKLYPLSGFYSNDGLVKAITNCSYFTSDYVLGRNQGDTYNDAPDQDFYSVVIKADGTYGCEKYASWEERDGVVAGFSPAVVLIKDGQDVELVSGAISDAKARLTTKNPNTAFGIKKDGKAILVVNTGRLAASTGLTGRELRTVLKKYYDLDLLVLLDGGGSSEMIIDGKLVTALSDGAERKMFNGLAFIDDVATQEAILPLRHTWVSQPMNGSYSHVGTKAIDFGSLSVYKDYDLYAPFDCKVVWADDVSKGGTVALQSLKPVIYADGTKDFMTVISEHSNDRPEKGMIFNQGQIYAHMGTAGNVSKHCHIEVQRGKYQKYTGLRYQSGIKANVYVFPNTIEPYKALFITKDTVIDKEASVENYSWKVLTEVTQPVARDVNKNQLKVLVNSLRVRSEHSTDGDMIGFVDKDGIYNDLDTYVDKTYTWHKIADNQWIADNGEWVELLPKVNTDLEELKKELTEYKTKVNELNEQLVKLTDDFAKVTDENKKLLEHDKLRETEYQNLVVSFETVSEKLTKAQTTITKVHELTK